MRSDIDSASSWSWVTKMVVMPSLRWIERISSRSETRILASSAESGSSSSSTCGLRRERAGQRHALLLAAGELVGIAVAELRQLDEAEHLGDARVDLGLRHAGDLQAEGDVLRDRQVGEQRIGLEHHADVALVRLEVGDVLAVDQDACRPVGVSKPAIMRSIVVLPQPDGPEEGDELAALDVEVEILDDRGRAEGLADALELERKVRSWVTPQFGRLRRFRREARHELDQRPCSPR